MTDVTAGPGQNYGAAELPAADEQLLRELTERAAPAGVVSVCCLSGGSGCCPPSCTSRSTLYGCGSLTS